MRKKTESLIFPKDPLAAMRELQELNTPSETLPEAMSEEEESTLVERRLPSSPFSTQTPPRPCEEQTGNPLQTAILEMLASPYASSPAMGPFTVTSIKMHTDLWNRLGWVSTLTGRPKQEIVAEALSEYLEKIRKDFGVSEGSGRREA